MCTGSIKAEEGVMFVPLSPLTRSKCSLRQSDSFLPKLAGDRDVLGRLEPRAVEGGLGKGFDLP